MLMGFLEFILSSVLSIFGMVLLIRAWRFVWAFSPRHPLIEVTRRATDWLIIPLSRFIKRQGAFDGPSLLSALVVAYFAVGVHALFIHNPQTPWLWTVAPLAMMVRWALEMIGWGAFIWVIMSWINPQSPMTYGLGTLLEPFLRPLRRLPLHFGRFDFSPVLLFLVVNILLNFVIPLSMGYRFF